MSGLDKLIANETIKSDELQRIEDEKRAHTASLHNRCYELNIKLSYRESDEQLISKIKRAEYKLKNPKNECYVVFSVVPKSMVYPVSIKVGITQYLSSYCKSIEEMENGFIIHYYRFESKQDTSAMQSSVFKSMERKRLGQYGSSQHRITISALTDGSMTPIIDDSEYTVEEIESKVKDLNKVSKYS
ncbi:hypothetical protein [Psychromonas sp.]|uniref:hypothetical protein n=1 Tax=Psychromonas sp. TaxID=1884585 RepID=UPI003565A767